MPRAVNKNVYAVSLGCPKNLVDTEFLLGSLTAQGYAVVNRPDEAGVLLVNTCAFIQAAVEESIETVLDLAAHKAAGSAWAVVVAGCLPERYREDFSKALPEADLICGTGGLGDLPARLEALRLGRAAAEEKWPKPGFIPEAAGPRFIPAPFWRAYLKIAEGCSNACSYCLIPRLRGPLRSRGGEMLVREAEMLAAGGVKELILVAQDTTAYGLDLKPRASLAGLIERLCRIDGLAWIRVMYAYPGRVTQELIQVMAEQPKVCAYLDLPLQHASPAVLRAMGRKGNQNLLALIRRLRKAMPEINLRTTFMVGFPGETDEDFDRLTAFIQEVRFDHVGVFKFSPEQGTAAAKRTDQVPGRIKENRRRRLMALQRKISREKNRAKKGKILPVLVEGFSPETDLLLMGRTPGQAPDVDGVVYITRDTARAGEIRRVAITQAHDYDLAGELVDQ